MPRDATQTGRGRSLPDLAGSVFSLILSLRSSDSYGTDQELRTRISEYLDRIDREGAEAGIPREDLEAAKYPLVAFIDETILSSKWESRDSWKSRPLQQDLYNERVAGEVFFEKLESLRGRAEDRRDLLEIYYHCLALGFEGKYSLLGKDRLRSLMDEVRRDLGYSRTRSRRAPISRSRAGGRSERSAHGPGRDLRLAIVCVAGLGILFLSLMLWIDHVEDRVVRSLRPVVLQEQ